MTPRLRPPHAAWFALLIATATTHAEEPAEATAPVPLNYKIELRCKLGDAPEAVFRLSDADGEFAAENPDPPIVFEAALVRREGNVFVLNYDCAWRQDVKEAPRDPVDPSVPKGRGSFNSGSTKGKARIAIGSPAVVFDAARAKVTLTLLEIPTLVDGAGKPIVVRQSAKVKARSPRKR